MAQRPLVLVGTEYTGDEVIQFQDLMTRERTPVAIPMTPSEILGSMGRPGRTHRYWDESSGYCDVVGGRCDIFLKTQIPLNLQSATSGFSMQNAIADQYLRLDQTDADDPDGLRRAYVIPYLLGIVQEIATMTHNRGRRVLSRHIQMGSQILGDIWRQELNLPEFASTEKPHTLDDQIVIFGGRGRWSLLTNQTGG